MSTSDNLERRKFIRNACLLTGAGLVSGLAWPAASGSWLTGVYPEVSGNHMKLRLSQDHRTRYRAFTLSAPPRLVVDLYSTQLSCNLDALKKTGFFQDVRWSQSPDKFRIVLDFHNQEKISYQTAVSGTRDIEIDIQRQGQHGITTAAASAKDLLVVIDPGHGGKDPGAVGVKGTYEKDVVLSISRKLRSRINGTKGFKAVLTRDQDKFIPLRRRVEIAHQHKADVFISIHADSCPDKKVSGSSVYILSQKGASSTMARQLANRENSADLVGGLSLKNRDEMLAKVLLDLSQTSTLQESARFAEELLTSLAAHKSILRNRIERAGFAVLKSADIPSVLVETAFISNPQEEKRLRLPAFQNKVADSLHQGLIRYCQSELA